MAINRIISAEPRDADGNLTSDRPCRKCGYNLRGLNVAGKCPECGTSVAFSLRGDMLRQSDPAWLELLMRGALIGMIGAGLTFVLGAFTRILGNFGNSGFYEMVKYLHLGAIVISGAGAWMITTPDPSGCGEDSYGQSRKLARIGTFSLLIYGVIDVTLDPRKLAPTYSSLVMFLQLIASAISQLGMIARMHFLSKLAGRIPNGKIRTHFGRLRYGFGLIGIIIVSSKLFFLMYSITKNFSGAIMILVSISFSGIGIAAYFGVGIWYLFTLNKLRRMLSHITREAKYHWSSVKAESQN